MIGIKATKANATLIETEKLTSGRVGLPIYFEFSTEWDGLGVTAVFKAGNVSIKKVLTVTNHRAETEVPWEVLVTPRVNLVVGLKGVKTNSQTGATETVIPTIYCGCGDTIEFGTDDNGASNTAPVTATDKQQMISAMETAVSNIIVAADVTVGSHSASEGNPSGTATLTSTSGGKKLSLALDYIKGLKGDKGDPTESIDDSKTDTSHTWSSSKLNTALNKKADIAEIAYVDEKFKWFHELMNGQEFDTTRREETAYSITAPNGAKAVEIEKICGKSQVMVQIAETNSLTTNGITVSVNSDGTYNISGTATAQTSAFLSKNNISITRDGRKYLYRFSKDSTSDMPYGVNGYGTKGSTSFIFSNSSGGTWAGIPNILIPSGTTVNIQNLAVGVFDLTAMFGSGNEPTIAEFNKLFPIDKVYPKTSSILDAKVRRIEVKGKNLVKAASYQNVLNKYGYPLLSLTLTENLKAGVTYTCSFTPNNAPNHQFYCQAAPAESGITNARFDCDGNRKSFTFTPAADCSLNIFFISRATDTDDVAITYTDLMIEKGSTATAYSAYHEPVTEPIPTALQTYLADKAYGASAETVNNVLDFENKKYTQKVASIDLGSLTWEATGTNNIFLCRNFESAPYYRGICAKYSTVLTNITWQSMDDKSVFLRNSNSQLLIRDTAYTDAATFKTAMNGVYLNYELATPVEYDISEYIHSFDPMMTVEAGGTITYKQVNDDVHIPIKNTVEYAIKLSEVTT